MQWYILIIISAILISLSDILKKSILNKEHSAEFSTTHSIIITLLLTPFIYNLQLNMSNIVIVLLIIKSILLLASSLLFMKAIKHNQLSKIMPLKNLSPVFLLILAFAILNEHISTQKLLGVFMILVSGYLLEKESLKKENILKNKYFIYVILSMIFVSISALLDKYLINYVNIYTLLYIPFLLMTIFMIIIQFTIYKGYHDIKHSVRYGGYWLIISAIVILISDFTYFLAVAIPGTFISLIIPLRRLSTLFSTILGGAIFHDKFIVDRIVLCLFMLVGVYLLVTA